MASPPDPALAAVPDALAAALAEAVRVALGAEAVALELAGDASGGRGESEAGSASPDALRALRAWAAPAVVVSLGVDEGGHGAAALGRLAAVRSERWEALPRELEALAPMLARALGAPRAEARATRAEETLAGLVAASDAGLILSDEAGRLVAANPASERLMGTGLAGSLGRPLADLVRERLKWRVKNPGEYEARVLPLLADPHGAATLEVETVDGRAMEHHSAPLRDRAGRPVGRVEILRDVTDTRAALAAARRLTEEQAAMREREERRAQEETVLARAGHMLASALTEADVQEELARQATALTGCEKTAVLTVDARGDVLPGAVHGFLTDTIKHMEFSLGEGVIGRVLANRRPFICNDTRADSRISSRITRPEGIRSFMHVPLVVGERVYGLLSVNSPEPRAFGERELRVVSELARHAASALQNSLRFEEERHIAKTLQQSLLAEELPRVRGLALAALYQASAGAQVGGDLYNAWLLPGGELAVLLGDVSGKGVEAAGVTAMVRYMTEALSQREASPARLLSELNELMCPRLADGSLVTVLLATIVPGGDTLTWASAGHPPPLLVDAARAARWLEDPGPPCGVFPGTTYTDHEEPFAAGDLLFAYTDGLTEGRRAGREFGETGVRAALLEAIEESPRALARSVYASARAWCEGRLPDDVAIAVVTRVGPRDERAPGPGGRRGFGGGGGAWGSPPAGPM